MNNKINQFVKYLAVALVSSVATLAVVIGINYDDIYLKNIIETQFYKEVDMEELERASKTAMVDALGDNYSFYIDEELGYENIMGQSSGNYCGIGISIRENEDNGVEIYYVMPGTPAEKSGLLAGDVITFVDETNVKGFDTTKISSLVKGEEGEELSLTVLRNGEEKTFVMTRDSIKATSVTSEKIGEIGYVNMKSFDDDAHIELKNHIDKLGDVKGLIVDVRDNPGGLLTTVIDALDLFIDQGDFIRIKYRGDKEEVFSATETNAYKMPLVVLTNENSASAAELFTAAIKENNRGISVGTNTFGKGTVQRSISLGNNTGINITIASFLSPKGNEIKEVGVAPDIEVKNSDIYRGKSVLLIPRENDLQLLEALKQFE